MPKVGRMTEHERRCKRHMATVAAECRMNECKNLTGLAAALGMNYQTLYASLRNGSITALRMHEIIKVLGPEAGDRICKI